LITYIKIETYTMPKKKKILYLNLSLMFLMHLLLCGNLFSQSWNQTTSFPGTPRDDDSYFKIGTKHFVGTGREVGFGCTRDFYFFDEATQSWGNTSPLPAGKERQYANATSYNGKGFLFGGVDCTGIYQNDLWTYDPVTDSWTELSVLPAAGRAGMVAFLLNDSWFVVGGKNTNGTLNEVWTYNFTSQTWVQKNNIPTDGIWRGIAFTFQNNAFIGLGRNNLNNQTGHNAEILSYQSDNDSWADVPNLVWGTRSYVGYAQTDSLLFLFGGLDSSGQILTSAERIHLSDFTTDFLPDFPSVARKGGVAFLVQNDLYYTTGVSTDTRFNETWRLDNVAVLDEVSSIQFHIFPNPARLEINMIGNKVIGSVELLDVYGNVQSSNQVNSTQFTLTLDHFSSGYYFLKVIFEGNEQIEKILISN